uniref:Chemosensory protein 9-like protein n=1 Tax=Antheraea pernyi TaxID=7119 RepID=A0AAU6R4I7_ANTPE
MWVNIIFSLTILGVSLTEMTAPGIERTLSDGVKSVGFNVIYGDEDLTLINEVVSEVEKSTALKSKINLNEAIPPLPAQDVKCLMSVDRHCSKDMGKLKGILIDALKDDCVKCSNKEKEDAGKIAASMMAHDPVAWKLFLTRYNGLHRVQRILG